jgi:hypothetical protein
MKYTISEIKLYEFMTNYLDSLTKDMNITRMDNFIVISDDSDETDIMEFDHSDGRMWINSQFLNDFNNLFTRGKLESLNFITNWFENKFGVKSKYGTGGNISVSAKK